MERVLDYRISKEYEGTDILSFLKSRGYSRTIITHLKRTPDGICRNGEWARTGDTLTEGDKLTVTIQEREGSSGILPVPLPLHIMYEDEDILVIDKPAGMPIHPSHGNHDNTLANALVCYYSLRGISFTYRCINRLDKKGFRLEFSSHMGSLIRREHYHTEVDCASPEEIIRMLCSGLVQAGVVEPEFTDVVLKREQMSPTSFVNTFAIPHAFGAFARNSAIAVAQLKNPVKWGVFEVRLVMLFAINKGDARLIKIFFDWISNIVNQPEELAKLAAPCEYEEFIDRIME